MSWVCRVNSAVPFHKLGVRDELGVEGEFCSPLSHAAWVMNLVHEGLYCTH